MSNTSKVLFVVGLLFAGLAAAPTHAQRCPSLSIGECRKTAAEGGDLLHEPKAANGQASSPDDEVRAEHLPRAGRRGCAARSANARRPVASASS